jgi:hypothetical protein
MGVRIRYIHRRRREISNAGFFRASFFFLERGFFCEGFFGFKQAYSGSKITGLIMLARSVPFPAGRILRHDTAPHKRRRLMSTERGCGKAQPQHVAGTQGDGNKVSAAAGL